MEIKNQYMEGQIKWKHQKNGWHDYKNKIWANVITVSSDSIIYWTWVPRYMYDIKDNNGTKELEVKFVDLDGKYKETVNGTEIEGECGLNLPDAFAFGEKDLKGYWVSKYEMQTAISNEEKINVAISGKNVEITSTRTATNSNDKYTIIVNGIDIEEEGVTLPYEIEGLKSNTVYEFFIYNNTTETMVGYIRRGTGNIEIEYDGFDPTKTYYVVYDETGNEKIAGRMDRIPEPNSWYNYYKKMWANLVTVDDSAVTYWTYVPRYEYSTKFNPYGDTCVEVNFIPKTQTIPDKEYKIPDAFTFGEKELSGYWVSKYEMQDVVNDNLERIEITNITDNSVKITTTNPVGEYTVWLNGIIIEPKTTLPYEVKNITSSYNIVLYSINNNRMVGSRDGNIAGINGGVEIEYSGIDTSKAYYVVYENDNESIAGRIDIIPEPLNWYDYDNKIWANIVTVDEDSVTYWTYIPRYEYYIRNDKNIELKLISIEQKTADSGYKIPEAFTFGGKDLKGYWVSKYEVQNVAEANIEKMSITAINGNSVTVTTSSPSGTYKIFVNGIETQTVENLTGGYVLNDVEIGDDIALYSVAGNRMIGSRKVQ